MFPRISGQFVATVFLAALLIITFFYYIFPKYDYIFNKISTLLGMFMYILIILAILCISISIIRSIIK